MRNQKVEIHELEQLSRELVRYFLSIHRYGLILPKRILLYGCPDELMTLMANIMKEELAGGKDITISIVNRSCLPTINSDGYYIDVGYFIGHAYGAEPTPIDEETWKAGSWEQGGFQRQFEGNSSLPPGARSVAATATDTTTSDLSLLGAPRSRLFTSCKERREF